MSDLVSFSAYARHVGVSQPTISNAVKHGRLAASVVTANGRRWIDRELADLEWSTARPRHRIPREVPPQAPPSVALPDAPPPEVPMPAAPPSAAPPADPPPPPRESVTTRLVEARAARETSEAQIAELRRLRMAGELAERAAVEAASFKGARLMRDSLLGLSPKLAPELATLSDAWEVERRLDAAFRRLLEDVTAAAAQDLNKALEPPGHGR